MIRFINHIIGCLILISMLTACSTTEENIMSADSNGHLSINAKISTTRSVITSKYFKTNDSIGVCMYNNDGTNYSTDGNNILSIYNGSKWQFPKGTINLSLSHADVYAYYPYASTISSYTIPITCDGNTDILYGKSSSSLYALDTFADITFNHALARLTFMITSTYNINSVTLSNINSGTAIANSGEMDIRNGSINHGENVNSFITTYSATASNTFDLLTIPTIVNNNILLTVKVNGAAFKAQIPNISWKQGSQYTYPVTISDSMTIGDPLIEARTNNDESTLNGSGSLKSEIAHLSVGGTVGDAVDLGLSVKWADHNIGATNPEDYGGLYSWGDPTGVLSSTNDDDFLTELPPKYISGSEFDIAYRQWGEDWILPSQDQFKELCENCTRSWTTVNGISGYLFTSKIAGYTDKSIFLPAAGRTYNNGTSQGDQCAYWNNYSFISTNRLYYAGCFTLSSPSSYYNSNEPWNYCCSRHYKLSVRPITTSK